MAAGSYAPSGHFSEKLSAVRDAQGTGWWVLYHGDNNNLFINFKVDGDKVSPLTTQAIGSPYLALPNNPYPGIGEMCYSPQGNKLLSVTFTGIVDVFDFDRCSGELSNWLALGAPAPNVPGPGIFYGCSFSPDGTKIYASENFTIPAGNRLFQWDLTAPNIVASKTVIFTAPDSVDIGQHQLGPDGKIYISQMYTDSNQPNNPNNFHISVIHNPNAVGLACNFQYQAVYLEGKHSTLGLPNLPNFNLPPLVAQVAEAGPPRTICAGDSVRIGYPDTTNGAVTYQWQPAAFVSSPTSGQTWVNPPATTMFYLEAIDTAMGLPCGRTIDSVLVTVADSSMFPSVMAFGDTLVCPGAQVKMHAHADSAQVGWNYTWVPQNGLSHPDSSTTTASLPGTYTITAAHPLYAGACFRDTAQVTVAWYPVPVDPSMGFAGRDTVICTGESLLLGTLFPGWTTHWTGPDITDSIPWTAQPQSTTSASNYILTLSDSASSGLCQIIKDTMQVRVEEQFEHEAPQDTVFCPGEAVSIGVEAQPGFSYEWTPIEWLQDPQSPSTLANPSQPMVYTLTVRSDTHQTTACGERAFTISLSTDGCPTQNILTPNGDGINDFLDLGSFFTAPAISIYDRWGKQVFSSSAYDNRWDALGLPDGVYWYVLRVPGEGGKERAGVVTVMR